MCIKTMSHSTFFFGKKYELNNEFLLLVAFKKGRRFCGYLNSTTCHLSHSKFKNITYPSEFLVSSDNIIIRPIKKY